MAMNLKQLLGQDQPEQQDDLRISPEEYAQIKKQEREQLWASVDQTTGEVFKEGKNLRDFLCFSRNHTYQSVTNQLLLFEANKGFGQEITQVRTFDKWQENGRPIKANSTGFPFVVEDAYEKDGEAKQGYKITKAFDISQTRGRAVPELPKKTIDELVCAIIVKSEVPVTVSDRLPDGIEAQYSHRNRTIYIRDGMDEATTFHALTRELAHAQMAKGNPAYTRSAYTAQAYCASFVTAEKYGVNTDRFALDRAAEMFSEKDPKELRGILTDIRYGAGAAISAVERGLRDMERSNGQEFSVSVQKKTKQSKVKADNER